jgi:Holliday junction DNA helicase RuvA
MIGKLKGFIDEIEFGFIILDVAGVGYNVYVSAQVVHQVSLGQKATLEIEMVVREDQITLYGFLNKEERAWFRLLQGVQGVGAKVALAVLGVMSISSLRDAILCGDSKMIQSVPGIGPKLATRIVNE